MFPTLISLILSFSVCFAAATTACFFQSLSYIFVKPFSFNAHRRIALHCNYAFFLVSTFLLQVWSNTTFKTYGDALPKDKSCFIIVNHSSSADFLIGLAHLAMMQYPSPGNVKSAVKASLGNIPLFGTILHFAEFLFLTRSWSADRENFLTSLHNFRDYETTVSPFWFVLFPEGTRLTPDKLQHSKQYAMSKGTDPLSHVLYPRFKAFTATMSALREQFDVVVDATYIYDSPISLKETLAGTANTVIHAHATCHDIKSLPEGEEQLEKWLLDRWYEKDSRISSFQENSESLGAADDSLFPVSKASVTPFYGLVLFFAASASIILYKCSQYRNGLVLLFVSSTALLLLVAAFVIVTNRPSRKGSSR